MPHAVKDQGSGRFRAADLGYDVIRSRTDIERARDALQDKAARERRLVPPPPSTDSTVIPPRGRVK